MFADFVVERMHMLSTGFSIDIPHTLLKDTIQVSSVCLNTDEYLYNTVCFI